MSLAAASTDRAASTPLGRHETTPSVAGYDGASCLGAVAGNDADMGMSEDGDGVPLAGTRSAHSKVVMSDGAPLATGMTPQVLAAP